jgi:hypothetical protein
MPVYPIYKRLGLSYFEADALCVAMGSSCALSTGELAIMVSSMHKFRVDWPTFREHFIRATSKGLLRFKEWEDLQLDFRVRKVNLATTGINVIRDGGVLASEKDQDEFRWYKQLELSTEYGKIPSQANLDKLSRKMIPFEGTNAKRLEEIRSSVRRANRQLLDVRQKYF